MLSFPNGLADAAPKTGQGGGVIRAGLTEPPRPPDTDGAPAPAFADVLARVIGAQMPVSAEPAEAQAETDAPESPAGHEDAPPEDAGEGDARGGDALAPGVGTALPFGAPDPLLSGPAGPLGGGGAGRRTSSRGAVGLAPVPEPGAGIAPTLASGRQAALGSGAVPVDTVPADTASINTVPAGTAPAGAGPATPDLSGAGERLPDAGAPAMSVTALDANRGTAKTVARATGNPVAQTGRVAEGETPSTAAQAPENGAGNMTVAVRRLHARAATHDPQRGVASRDGPTQAGPADTPPSRGQDPALPLSPANAATPAALPRAEPASGAPAQIASGEGLAEAVVQASPDHSMAGADGLGAAELAHGKQPGPAVASGQPTAGPKARAVVSQIATAVQDAGDGSVEIHLSPAELGKVRITLTPGEAGMSVSILADRAETLDMLRRHADLLARDFRDLGYAGTAFSFGTEGGAPRHHAGPARQGGNAAEPATPAVAVAAPAPAAQPPAHIAHSPDGGMDIRL